MTDRKVELVSPAVYFLFAMIVLGLVFGFGYVRGMKRIQHEYEKILSEKFYGIGVEHVLSLYPPGLVVSDVFPETPAEKAGLRKFDVILHVNYWEATIDRLQSEVRSGKRITLRIRRRGEEFDVLITPELMQRKLIVSPFE